MPDLVATVPKDLWWAWLWEGDLPGDEPTGETWGFFGSGAYPPIQAGERLYIVAWGRLRGYAPVTGVERTPKGWAIGRRGGAVACTIPEPIRGFRGWRERWWSRESEQPFPDWMAEGVGKTPDYDDPHYELHLLLREQKRRGRAVSREDCMFCRQATVELARTLEAQGGEK